MSTRMDHIKANVLRLVRLNKELAGDYNKLIVTYWNIFDKVDNLWDVSNASCASSESITRAMRELVSEGAVSLDDDVVEIRKNHRKVYQQRYAALSSY